MLTVFIRLFWSALLARLLAGSPSRGRTWVAVSPPSRLRTGPLFSPCYSHNRARSAHANQIDIFPLFGGGGNCLNVLQV